MKKLIAIVLCLVCMATVFTACGKEKTPLTTDEFISKMEAHGFYTSDVTDQIPDSTGKMTKVIFAENNNYRVEFYQITDADSAASIFAGNSQQIESNANGASGHVTLNLKNSNYYELTDSEGVVILARVADTLMYCECEKDDSTAVKDLFKTLGYK